MGLNVRNGTGTVPVSEFEEEERRDGQGKVYTVSVPVLSDAAAAVSWIAWQSV